MCLQSRKGVKTADVISRFSKGTIPVFNPQPNPGHVGLFAVQRWAPATPGVPQVPHS